MQSLISTQPQKNEKGNSFFFERGQVPLRTYKLFYESPTSNETTEINVQLKEEATVLDFINLAISSLKSNKKNISENYTFTVYFAKKSGIPKNDLPGIF